VAELGLAVGANTLGMGCLGQLLVGEGLGAVQQAAGILEAGGGFVAGVLQLHDPDLCEDELLPHAGQDLGRVRLGGIHVESIIKSLPSGM
jgi:hypothetical protein